MPGLAVKIRQLDGQFTAADILVLQLQAVDGVIQLAVNPFTVFSQRRLAIDVHAFQQGQLFPFNANRQLLQGDFLLTDALIEAGHLGGAVGFQVIEVQLNFLVVFIQRVDLTAARFAAQTHRFAFRIRIELELTAAEGDFLIAFRIVEWF